MTPSLEHTQTSCISRGFLLPYLNSPKQGNDQQARSPGWVMEFHADPAMVCASEGMTSTHPINQMKLFTSIAAAAAVIGTAFITVNPANAYSVDCTSYGSLGMTSCTDSNGGTWDRTDYGSLGISDFTYTPGYGGGSSINCSTTSYGSLGMSSTTCY